MLMNDFIAAKLNAKKTLILTLVFALVLTTFAYAAPTKQEKADMKVFTTYLKSTIMVDFDTFMSTVKGANAESLKPTFDAKLAYYKENETVVYYQIASMKKDTKHKVSKTYGTPYSVVYYQAEVDTINMTSLRITKITGGSYVKSFKGKPYVTNDLTYSGKSVTWSDTPPEFRKDFEAYVKSVIGAEYTSPDNPTER